MKKKLICIVFLFCLGLIGCTKSESTKDESNGYQEVDSSKNQREKNEYVKDNVDNSNLIINIEDFYSDFKLRKLGSFYDGYAWIQYSYIEDNEEKNVVSLINKDGEIVDFINADGDMNKIQLDEFTTVEDFFEGYASVRSEKSCYFFDKSNNYQKVNVNNSENAKIIESGGKYCLLSVNDSNFEKSTAYLMILDNEGNEKARYEYTPTKDVIAYYVGNGIFSVVGNYGDKENQFFCYFSIDGSFTDCLVEETELGNKGEDYFSNGIDTIVVGAAISTENQTIISILNKNNEIEHLTLPLKCYSSYGGRAVSNCNADGWIVCRDARLTEQPSEEVVTAAYNIFTGEMNYIQEQFPFGYFDKNNIIPFQVKGKDGKQYTILYNENLERVSEPVLGKPSAWNEEGILEVEDEKEIKVYQDSNMLFSLSKENKVSPFSDDIARVAIDEQIYDEYFSGVDDLGDDSLNVSYGDVYYVDLNGNKLFDQIVMKSVEN